MFIKEYTYTNWTTFKVYDCQSRKFYNQIKMDSIFFRETRPTNCGFKSNATPSQNENHTPFENGFYDMVWSIKFKSNNFQFMLREDLNKIKSPRNLLVFADKTMNLY